MHNISQVRPAQQQTKKVAVLLKLYVIIIISLYWKKVSPLPNNPMLHYTAFTQKVHQVAKKAGTGDFFAAIPIF